MIELPNKKKCYNLPEQVAQNLLNIQYLAEQYKNIDALPAIWQTYKEEFDNEFDTFEGWERTFGGWETTLETYLASMSSAAVGALAGQDVSVRTITQTNANWGETPYVSGGGGIPATPIYNRFEVIGNILYVVLNYKLVNDTGASVTIYGMAGNIAVPSAYASKIIDFEGDNATVAKAQAAIICAGKGQVFNSLNSTYFDDINVSLTNSTSAGYVGIEIASAGLTIPNGETRYVTARLFLTLI